MSNPPFKRFWPLVACALLALTVLLWWQSRPAPIPAKPKSAPKRAAVTVPPPIAPNPQPEPPPTDPNDPRTALASALAQADPRMRFQQFGQLLAQWIARDPEAALGYVRQMPRGSERAQALFQVLDVLSRRDLDRGLALARELLVTREERYFYSALFDRLARENVQVAVQQLPQVPNGDG